VKESVAHGEFPAFNTCLRDINNVIMISKVR